MLGKNLKIKEVDARIRLSALLKSKSSMRWYKDYRIDKIDESNTSEVMRVYEWTKIFFRARFLLPKVLDCDSLSIITKEHMASFFVVLG